MEVVELLPLIWATLARSQSVCPWEPYGRGSSGHIRGGMASNPPTMRTRRNHGRRLFAKNSGRRWTLPAVPMGAGGRPHTAGKLVTSSFSWAGSGVLDGCEVGADRRRNRFAQKNLSAQNSLFTDTSICRKRPRALLPPSSASGRSVARARAGWQQATFRGNLNAARAAHRQQLWQTAVAQILQAHGVHSSPRKHRSFLAAFPLISSVHVCSHVRSRSRSSSRL